MKTSIIFHFINKIAKNKHIWIRIERLLSFFVMLFNTTVLPCVNNKYVPPIVSPTTGKKRMRKFRNVTWKLSTYAAIIHPIPTTHNHVNANGSTFCFLASLNKSIICKRPTVQTLNNDRIKK